MGRKQEMKASVAAESGDAEVKEDTPFWRTRPCLICLSITVITILILAVVAIVLYFTVLKAKDPRIIVNSIMLQNFQASLNLPMLQPTITLALSLNVTVTNPNRASFKFSNSTTYLFYHGEAAGDALMPGGEIGALGKLTTVALLKIQADRFILNPNLFGDISQGMLPISSQTVLSGRVKLLKFIKRHATSTTVCEVVISIANRSIADSHCSYKAKL